LTKKTVASTKPAKLVQSFILMAEVELATSTLSQKYPRVMGLDPLMKLITVGLADEVELAITKPLPQPNHYPPLIL
jgi:hypothetical protein